MPTTQIPKLPTLGTPIAGGLYAGITTGPDGAAYALILLADKPSRRLDWPAAMAWAESLQATLPTRPEGALLFANLRDQFEGGWHWLGEQCSAGYAWGQSFDDGYQSFINKSFQAHARAFRRFPLESFIPLVTLVAAEEEATAQVPA